MCIRDRGYAGGIVNGWQEIDGIVYLGINGNLYDINDVDQVIDKDYYETVSYTHLRGGGDEIIV